MNKAGCDESHISSVIPALKNAILRKRTSASPQARRRAKKRPEGRIIPLDHRSDNVRRAARGNRTPNLFHFRWGISRLRISTFTEFQPFAFTSAASQPPRRNGVSQPYGHLHVQACQNRSDVKLHAAPRPRLHLLAVHHVKLHKLLLVTLS
jgi:hypothetical protein